MANAANQLQQALRNGYSGPTVQRGNDLYTPYGALLRNDGFQYPEGAKISPNGMYVDTGNGWQYAKPNTSVSGLAPGANALGPGESWSKGTSGTPEAPTPATPTPEEPKPSTTPSPELEAYWRRVFGY